MFVLGGREVDRLEQIRELRSRSTVAADRACDAGAFVEPTREAGCVPHVAPVTYRRSAIDRRTTRHASLLANICAAVFNLIRIARPEPVPV